jgi:hypothetical protein
VSDGYVLFVWSPEGYAIRELDGVLPTLGQELEESGHAIVINKIGVSPLPGDARPCAYSVGKS